jgi:hypothetical protein
VVGSQRQRLQFYEEGMVWYFLFIIYTMYCILPIPFKWCVITCTAAAAAHVLSILIVTSG